MNYHRDQDYIKNEGLFRNIFLKRFSLIDNFIGNTGTVLDIGCSNGVFLDLFKEKGFETWGAEPSKSAKVAREKGHKITKGDFEKVKLPEAFFDIVILNHTLEHLDNPDLVLKKVHIILKKKGILFVDVPNAGGLGSRLMGAYWPYRLPDEHKWQFTDKSLKRVFNDSGFKVLAWQSRSGIFEYANPILELRRKRFILDIISLPFSLVATLFNMGDSMSMVGERI